MKIPASETDLFSQAAIALEACFDAVPATSVVINQKLSLAADMQPDYLAEIIIAGRHITFLVELKKSGEPQFARNAIGQIERYRRSLGLTEAGGIFIAPFISEATAKICREEGVGYLDLSGNCHIAFHGVYIHIEGKPNAFARSRSLLSLYNPKAERVLRVLLTSPFKPWRLQSLADESGVSIGQSFKVKKLLLEKEWLEEDGQGIRVTKPTDLLADWAEHYRFSKHQAKQYYTLSNIDSFALIFSTGCQQHGIMCAFTSLVAAARYAPHATYRRITAYVHYETAKVQELLSLPPLQLAPVETGADVILLSPYDDGVFYGRQNQQGISLVSPVQTYLDLQNTGARGHEAAEVLLQKEILPNW